METLGRWTTSPYTTPIIPARIMPYYEFYARLVTFVIVHFSSIRRLLCPVFAIRWQPCAILPQQPLRSSIRLIQTSHLPVNSRPPALLALHLREGFEHIFFPNAFEGVCRLRIHKKAALVSGV